METNEGILMIEPRGKFSVEPVIDKLTRKMTAAWRKARHAEDGYRGFHICECGTFSDNKDHWVGEGEGLLTNSLCIHYLAYHHADVPKEELEKVRTLHYGEAEPTEKELAKPSNHL